MSNNDIFIIDDSNTNVVLIEAILETKGYSSRTALSVKDAWPQIKKNKPSLILLDLLMPALSGFDFMEKIKKEPELNKIPIIVISALSDQSSIQKTYELGAVAYLTKPLDIFALMEAVEKSLN
ncbi:MAG: response regulator [Bacteroidales bacterium]|nr:response regulator [Bacteroidales bacterium]MCF8392204.1 response regulator [Bacteroidales bacterium]